MNELELALLNAARAVRDASTANYLSNPTPVDDVILQFEAIEDTFENLVYIRIINEVVGNNRWTSNATTWLALITDVDLLRKLVRELTGYGTLNFSAADLESMLDVFETISF